MPINIPISPSTTLTKITAALSSAESELLPPIGLLLTAKYWVKLDLGAKIFAVRPSPAFNALLVLNSTTLP